MTLTTACTEVNKKPNEYEILELGMTITIPENFNAITRNSTKKDYQKLVEPNFTLDERIIYMNQNNMYLDAYRGKTKGLTINMYQMDFVDFNSYRDEAALIIAEDICKDYVDVGIDYEIVKIYHTNQAKFIVANMQETNLYERVKRMQYWTVYDFKLIEVTFFTYTGIITEDDEAILKAVVDSIVFTKEPSTIKKLLNPTAEITYKDEMSKTIITIPKNWRKYSEDYEKNKLRLVFLSEVEEGWVITYSSINFKAVSKNEFNKINSLAYKENMRIRNEILSKYYKLPIEDFTLEVINDVTYHKVIYKARIYDNYDREVDRAIYFRFEGDYLYSFEFSGVESDEYFQDFKSVLISVSFGE